MKEIYHTVLTSRRHRELGFCEEGDFGTIKLLQVSEEEAPLICNIKDYKLNMNLRLFKKQYYVDFNTWKNETIFKEKQGRLTEKTAIRLMVKERNKAEKNDNFYPASSRPTYLLIGRRIYEFYCDKKNLSITETGNTMFGNWWTLDIEPHHPNKGNTFFNKEKFEQKLEEAKKFIKKKNKNRTEKISFSYPRIKWIHPELIRKK